MAGALPEVEYPPDRLEEWNQTVLEDLPRDLPNVDLKSYSHSINTIPL